jgi:hypothetical protein
MHSGVDGSPMRQVPRSPGGGQKRTRASPRTRFVGDGYLDAVGLQVQVGGRGGPPEMHVSRLLGHATSVLHGGLLI